MLSKVLKTILSKIKIGRVARFLRINPDFFFDSLVYNFSKLFRGKIDKNLIIVGGNYGKFFGGNTKYIYLYLKENTDYDLYWISRNIELNKQLEEKGIKTIYSYSLEAIKMLKKARAIFVTHGYIDTIPIKNNPGTLFIQTWHAGGNVKVIGPNKYFEKYIRSKWAKLLGVKLQSSNYYSYLVGQTNAERQLKVFTDGFKYPLNRIILTGYPRNDILFSKDPNLKKRIRKDYDISDNIERIILYAPTFRPDFVYRFPLGKEDLKELDQLMKNTNSLFLLSAHIKERIIEFEDLEYVRNIGRIADTQELLIITDILITDYSSIYCDYLLLNRPILFFTYDYDKFIEEWGLFYDHLEEVAPGPLLYSAKELFEAINNISNITKEYADKYKKLRSYFNKHLDGNSTERLLRFLKLID